MSKIVRFLKEWPRFTFGYETDKGLDGITAGLAVANGLQAVQACCMDGTTVTPAQMNAVTSAIVAHVSGS